jgi:outer membrane lipoprotein SlyB
MNSNVASALQGLYARFGDQILTQPPRLASLLRDECPEAKPEISALVKALEEQVPQNLMEVQSGVPLSIKAAQLARRLSSDQLMARDASDWAVWAWGRGVGINDEYFNGEAPAVQNERSIVVPAGHSAPAAYNNAALQPVEPKKSSAAWIGVPIALAALGAAGYWGHHLYKNRFPPPHIAGIEAPRSIRVGSKYVFTISYDNAGAGVTAIERHVLQSSVKWDQDTKTQTLNGFEKQPNGSIPYDFDPESTPSKSTVQFVLIDGNGKRSEPQSVSYQVLPLPVAPAVCSQCGKIENIQQIETAAPPTGMGATIGVALGATIGQMFGHGKARVATTTAGAITGGLAGNSIEGHANKRVYWDVTVRFNKGGSQTISAYEQPSWHVGDRVKLVHGEIEAD